MLLPRDTTVLVDLGKKLWSQLLHSPCSYTIADHRWDCHGLPVEFEIDKKLSKQLNSSAFSQQTALSVLSMFVSQTSIPRMTS